MPLTERGLHVTPAAASSSEALAVVPIMECSDRWEHGGELALLGQDELDISVLEAALRDQLARQGGDSVRTVLETERIVLAAARVGQHVFAVQVPANRSGQCVFCGLRPTASWARRMRCPWSSGPSGHPAPQSACRRRTVLVGSGPHLSGVQAE